MRAVFMGTPRLAAEVLRRISEDHEVVGVFTRPDAVRGRGNRLQASPVKELAVQLGLPVHQPASLRDADAQRLLGRLAPDVVCVAAYGMLLPAEVLAMPRFGCLNVHTSLLPRWRGAAPMERAILAGDERTGVCVMGMREGLDTGPVCRRAEIDLQDLYLEDVEARLTELGAEALADALAELQRDGSLKWQEQPDRGVTYAAKLEKGELDPAPEDTARGFCAKVRASSAAHPAHALVAGREATVLRARPLAAAETAEFAGDLAPGEVAFRAKRLLLGAVDGAVEVQELKPQGKKAMAAAAFAAGVQGLKSQKGAWGR